MTDIAPEVEQVLYLEEPSLQFASGQTAFDPRDGLALFGPFSQGQPSHPQSPAYMVIGAPEGVAAMRAWSEAMNQAFAVAEARKHRLWPPYPGFEVAFGSRWSGQAAASYELDREKLIDASRKHDNHERCFAVVEQFMEAFDKARKKDTKIAVAICVVPDEVKTNCRTESRVADATDAGISKETKKSRKRGQMEFFESFDPEQYKLSPDFRRQLKARTMRFDIPLQIIQESTLRLSDVDVFGERRLTRLSDRMWNLGTALYYKSGGKPWKLNTARDGVCYIGIAFRKASEGPKTACCAAQMFLDSGDGIVFLGEYGPWYSPDNNQFHLTQSAAKKLLEGVLKTYSDEDGKPLKEIFLHSRSSISKEEFAGYQEACPPGCKLVGVRVRSDSYGPRLFRDGSMPVIRGTFLKTGKRSGFLYAAGFKPRLGTYDGWETPVPLRIDIQHGESEIELVATDILGLTKLNYNACKLGDSQPVTVGFSDAVGENLDFKSHGHGSQGEFQILYIAEFVNLYDKLPEELIQVRSLVVISHDQSQSKFQRPIRVRSGSQEPETRASDLKGSRMAKKFKIRTVKTVHTSNVGANEDTKTLWVFGAGASRHLGFPLSFDLFSKSVCICTAKLKTFSGAGDVGYSLFSAHYSDAGEPVPSPDDIAKFKDDACLALEYAHVWDYLKPEISNFVPIQDLFRLWVELPPKLLGIGINLTPRELLATYPETLINRVREVDSDALVRDKLAYDKQSAILKIKAAQEALQQIYFFTLSLINDAARETTRHKPLSALYTQLVRSFILDKNARILTFNYDTMLDEAIFTHFTRSWKYGGMTIAGINGYPVAAGAPADLIVIKPHGSLNYIICGKCKRQHVNWFWSYRRTGANTLSSGNRRCVFCTAPSPGRRELMGSLTVAPLYDKQIIKKSFKAISQALVWADHVVSVGYSFPDQDTYVYRLMGEAIKSRTGAALTVSIVSHTPESAREIAKRLRSGLKRQGVPANRFKITSTKLRGFEEVQTGSASIPVKL